MADRKQPTPQTGQKKPPPPPVPPRRKNNANDFVPGTNIKQVGSISLCCIAPEYRDCLDRAMEEWTKHRKTLPKILMGKRYRPDVYAFAYWLIRWSGLVEPTNRRAQGE